jgi:hypothetical protein
MRSLDGIDKQNERAIRREFDDAVADGNRALANRIAAANPDLLDMLPPPRRPVQRVQTRNGG